LVRQEASRECLPHVVLHVGRRRVSEELAEFLESFARYRHSINRLGCTLSYTEEPFSQVFARFIGLMEVSFKFIAIFLRLGELDLQRALLSSSSVELLTLSLHSLVQSSDSRERLRVNSILVHDLLSRGRPSFPVRRSRNYHRLCSWNRLHTNLTREANVLVYDEIEEPAREPCEFSEAT
jgi:hypothetical protein